MPPEATMHKAYTTTTHTKPQADTLHMSNSQLLVQSIHSYMSTQLTCCFNYCPPASISSLEPGQDKNTWDIPSYHPTCDLT